MSRTIHSMKLNQWALIGAVLAGCQVRDNIWHYPTKNSFKKAFKESILSDREKEVLYMRFGLNNKKSSTLKEVGKKFGVTIERIRQIEAKAMRKLKFTFRRILYENN